MELQAGSATDVGLVRSNNQDELLVAPHLFAVADGMGGAAAGEVASATAIERLRDAFSAAGTPTPEDLIEAAQEANRAVWEQAEANPEMRGMGTTLVALAPVADGRLAVINIGDSRLYLLHDGELRQVTSDHNLVAELLAEGRLSKEEAEYHPRRNIMTRALGVDPEVPVDLFMLDAHPGDRFLLCSDGLPRELHDDQIASLLRRLADPEEAAQELVDEAKRRGGNDNITVVVVDVVAPREEKDSDLTTAVPAAPPVHPAAIEAKPTAKRSIITLRVVGFVGLLIVLLGLGAAGIGWYARAAYYVGLRADRITIFQGRPGGVLWFRPTIADATNVTTADVESRHIPTLTAGQDEPSLSSARQFVHALVAEQQAAQAAARPTPQPPPKSRSTTPPTT
ncbi:MAG TPA: Stp1/IreP family PP2C-type Ser/Thr phosphatase [Acidimicrobiales bacterium]